MNRFASRVLFGIDRHRLATSRFVGPVLQRYAASSRDCWVQRGIVMAVGYCKLLARWVPMGSVLSWQSRCAKRSPVLKVRFKLWQSWLAVLVRYGSQSVGSLVVASRLGSGSFGGGRAVAECPDWLRFALVR